MLNIDNSIKEEENFSNENYYISITTIPPRIEKTEEIIKSFLNQNIGQPIKIIINIPKKYKGFPNDDILNYSTEDECIYNEGQWVSYWKLHKKIILT